MVETPRDVQDDTRSSFVPRLCEVDERTTESSTVGHVDTEKPSTIEQVSLLPKLGPREGWKTLLQFYYERDPARHLFRAIKDFNKADTDANNDNSRRTKLWYSKTIASTANLFCEEITGHALSSPLLSTIVPLFEAVLLGLVEGTGKALWAQSGTKLKPPVQGENMAIALVVTLCQIFSKLVAIKDKGLEDQLSGLVVQHPSLPVSNKRRRHT